MLFLQESGEFKFITMYETVLCHRVGFALECRNGLPIVTYKEECDGNGYTGIDSNGILLNDSDC